MALRIAGVNLPEGKRVETALTYLYGLGLPAARSILTKAGVSPDIRIKALTSEQVEKIRQVSETQYKLENQLRQEVLSNIRRLKEIGTYRGHRHAHNLPVRGQRTRTNARTRRGKRVTVGSGRKKTAEKT